MWLRFGIEVVRWGGARVGNKEICCGSDYLIGIWMRGSRNGATGLIVHI